MVQDIQVPALDSVEVEKVYEALRHIYYILELNNQLFFIIAVLLFLVLFTIIVKSVFHL